uniref:DUF148 domain-containing protein n=1 Tax=Syphacia muris TaxID=451379 RepID=A0A0N5AWB3_9BILA
MFGFIVYVFAVLLFIRTEAGSSTDSPVLSHSTQPYIVSLLEHRSRQVTAKLVSNPVTSYLSKISDKKWKELEALVKNDTLTKQDAKQQLQAWAAEQGSEFLTEFNKEMMEKSRVEAEISHITRTLLENLVVLYDRLQSVKNNMTITKRQEQQQLIKLMSKSADSVIDALRSVEEEAARQVNSTKQYTSLITDLLAHLRIPAMRRRLTAQQAIILEITTNKPSRLMARPQVSIDSLSISEQSNVPVFGTPISVERSYW